MSNNCSKVAALILAAGSGSRMRSDTTKQRMKLEGKSVLWHTVRAFSECPDIDYIIAVCREDEIEEFDRELSCDFKKLVSLTVGGKNRAESARLGFSAIPEDSAYVAIHDGARCLITPEMITSVVNSAKKYGAASAVSKVSATLKVCGEEGFILSTLPRENAYFAETPQIFEAEKYRRALASCESTTEITDDNMLLEAIGEKVYWVDVGSGNLKITTPEDIAYAEYIIKRRK